MFLALNHKSVLLATTLAFSSFGVAQAQSETKEVAIEFAAYVGEEEFVCGESYEGIGTGETTITPNDFRFYVSDIALIDGEGNAVPLELEQDGKWQYQNAALLDFEDGTSACDNGTAEVNTTVVGVVPEGDYQSLQFTLGVPKNLNHDDAAIAPSPLNLTSMWWNRQEGYKFLRIEMETDRAIANAATSTSQTTHSQGGEDNVQINQQTTSSSGQGNQSTTQTSNQTSIFKNGQGTHQQTSTTTTSGDNAETTHSQSSSGTQEEEQNVSNNAYLVHLGSTGCTDSSQSSLFDCANPNRAKVVLEDFNPDDNVVIADLAELLAQSDLTTNQANTPNGCMSSPEDADCAPIMENLGLASGATAQNFFFVE
jgi:uncharacterized repeat protein (TIGR04052 family)